MSDAIINKVSSSPLVTIDLEDFKTEEQQEEWNEEYETTTNGNSELDKGDRNKGSREEKNVNIDGLRFNFVSDFDKLLMIFIKQNYLMQ